MATHADSTDTSCGTTNVIAFPAKVVADENVRRIKRLLEHFEHNLEHCDPDSPDRSEAVKGRMAPRMVAEYSADLRKAIGARAAFDAPDAIHHNGVIYAEMAGRA